jgi:hypothetical protein
LSILVFPSTTGTIISAMKSCCCPHPAMLHAHPFPLYSSFSSPASTWTSFTQYQQCATPPWLSSSTHTSKTCHMYFCSKMHYAVPRIHLMAIHVKVSHARTKPPNSPRMVVHHSIGCQRQVSLCIG